MLGETLQEIINKICSDPAVAKKMLSKEFLASPEGQAFRQRLGQDEWCVYDLFQRTTWNKDVTIAIQYYHLLDDFPPEKWWEIIRVSLIGIFLDVPHALRRFRQFLLQDRGRMHELYNIKLYSSISKAGDFIKELFYDEEFGREYFKETDPEKLHTLPSYILNAFAEDKDCCGIRELFERMSVTARQTAASNALRAAMATDTGVYNVFNIVREYLAEDDVVLNVYQARRKCGRYHSCKGSETIIQKIMRSTRRSIYYNEEMHTRKQLLESYANLKFAMEVCTKIKDSHDNNSLALYLKLSFPDCQGDLMDYLTSELSKLHATIEEMSRVFPASLEPLDLSTIGSMSAGQLSQRFTPAAEPTLEDIRKREIELRSAPAVRMVKKSDVRHRFKKELMTRLSDFHLINQGGNALCGVAVFVAHLAEFDPVQYVSTSLQLLTDKQFVIRNPESGKSIKVENTLSDIEMLSATIDAIYLGALRRATNRLGFYSSQIKGFFDYIQSYTTPSDIVYWWQVFFGDCDIKNTAQICVGRGAPLASFWQTITGAIHQEKFSNLDENLQLAVSEFSKGAAVCMLMTMDLVRLACPMELFFADDLYIPLMGSLNQIGHFVKVTQLKLLEEQEKKYVLLNIETWGKSYGEHKIPYDKFMEGYRGVITANPRVKSEKREELFLLPQQAHLRV